MILKKPSLTQWIFFALVLAVAAGLLFRGEMAVVKPVGDLFIAMLKALIAPVIFFSVVAGITGLPKLAKLRRLGWITGIYYLLTTMIAVVTGLLLVTLIHPGKRAGVDVLSLVTAAPTPVASAPDFSMFLNGLASGLVMNPVKAFAENQVLAIIVFALSSGIAIQSLNPVSQGLADGCRVINAVVIRILDWLMWLAPIGLFCLVAPMIGALGLGAFRALGWFMVTVAAGIVIHGFGTLGLILYGVTRRSPLSVFRAILEPLVVAFSTASSTATLPVTMRTAVEKLDVKAETAELVIPIGATVNMDGTALYEAVAAVFIAEIYGIHLGPASLVIVFLMSTVTAIGAPGIPSAGMVTMLAVLSAVGLPLEGIGLLLTVDRLLDALRTTLNVEGDLIAACVVDKVA